MNRLKLDDVEWKEFIIENLFKTLKRGNNKSIKDIGIGNDIPYIGAKYNNNGVTGFIDEKSEFNLFEGNSIVFIMTGEGSVGKAIYKKENFVPSNNVYVGYTENLNKFNGQFIVTVINNQEDCYNYGYIRNERRLKKEKLKLPIDSSGGPNWKFMEEYIKQEQKIQAQKIIDYYEQKILKCGFELLGLEDVEWREFYITELFDIKRGNQNNMAACKDGEIPIVSAKKVDNGYKAFISDNGKEMFDDNILTLNNDGDGGVGMAFYQPHHMALDTHVTALIPKFPIDKFSLLFLSRAITNQRDKFSHGYSINNSRLQKQKIILPADENGNPHYEYMRIFMQKLETENLSKVLEYIYI